jgi:hypothetical protein
MMLRLAHLVERVYRNSDENRLTCAVFLDVAKAFDTLWVEVVLYKLHHHHLLSRFRQLPVPVPSLPRSSQISPSPVQAYCPKLPTLLDETHMLISLLLDILNFLPVSHIYTL